MKEFGSKDLVLNLFQISPCVIVIFAAVTEPSISFYFKTSVLSPYLLDDSHVGMNLLRSAGEQNFSRDVSLH